MNCSATNAARSPGADSARTGLLELAHGATVFFDEAGDIPPNVQVKLLRVLEQHEVTPVGKRAGTGRTTFRVIAATNRPVDSQPEALRAICTSDWQHSRFTCLRCASRCTDIPLLAEAFLRRAARRNRRCDELLAAMQSKNCAAVAGPATCANCGTPLSMALLLARGRQIEVEHLPPADPELHVAVGDDLQTAVRSWTQRQLASRAAEGNIYQEFLSRVEPSLFDVVLEQTTGNRAAAADLLRNSPRDAAQKLASSDES